MVIGVLINIILSSLIELELNHGARERPERALGAFWLPPLPHCAVASPAHSVSTD